MIQGPLLRLGLWVVAGMVAKFFAIRWIGANFDLRNAIDKLGVDLKNLAKDIETKGSKFSGDLSRLISDFARIQDGENVDIQELLELCNRTIETYRALPTAAKAMVRARIDIEGHVKDVAKHAIEQEGWRLVGEKAPSERTLSEHLANQYRGLHYLGFAGRATRHCCDPFPWSTQPRH